MTSSRRLWAGAGMVVLVAGAMLSLGSPRLTILNAGLRVEYPWRCGAGALLSAAGGLLVGRTARRQWVRAIAAGLGLLGLAVGLQLLRYRVDADESGIGARGLLGSTRLSWEEVVQVESLPSVVVVSARGRRIRMDVADFRPQDRAALDRTIARRVRETPSAGP